MCLAGCCGSGCDAHCERSLRYSINLCGDHMLGVAVHRSSDPSFPERTLESPGWSLAPTLYRPDSIHRSSCYAGARFIFGQSANYLFRYCLLSSSTCTNFRNIRRFERARRVTSKFRSNIDMVRDRCARDGRWRVRVGRSDCEHSACGYRCPTCKRWVSEMHKR